MSLKRTAKAHWSGTFKEGSGDLTTQSTTLNKTQYSFKTRFAEGVGTNPEELLAAAHAGCFSMALAAGLTKAGHNPKRISTNAAVSLEKVGEGFKITSFGIAIVGIALAGLWMKGARSM